MSPIESNLQHVRQGIDAVIAGLPASQRRAVQLIAVSKSKSAEDIRTAYAAGQQAFGENYVQEALGKIAALADLKEEGIEWHFIGPLQSNKAKQVAHAFDWVHSLDRLKIAELLSRHRIGNPMRVCIQVNISNEPSKGGIAATDVLAFAHSVLALPGLALHGLMTIIENTPNEASKRAQFRQMRELLDSLNANGIASDTLSMGMSQDYALAIEEGATMVRIGSALFGTRTQWSRL